MWWSQVVSGVVTLGCLSPRPRLHAPVGACACVHACVCVCRRVRAFFVGGVYVVWWSVVGAGVVGAYLFLFRGVLHASFRYVYRYVVLAVLSLFSLS